MKTISLSRVDLYMQYGLVAINLCAIAAALVDKKFMIPLLIFQIIINVYHFTTNLFHLRVQHRSVGFTQYRDFYHTLTLIYIPVGLLITPFLIANTALFITVWLILPQIVLHLYTYLCKKEIDFIEQNEFHILK